MKIYIVIPLYNEEKHIDNLLKDLSKYDLPIVVVDDGSSDNSKFQILHSKFHNITLLEHKVNLGKGASMKTGADYAFSKGAEAVIFMDSDGQHSATDLPKFIEEIKKDRFDLFFGTRVSSYGVPLVRFLGNKFASVVVGLLFNVYVSDSLCGFRGLTKKAYKKVTWESDGYGVEIEMIARMAKNKLKFTEIPVETIYHNSVKGVTLLDAFSVLFSVVKWRLTI